MDKLETVANSYVDQRCLYPYCSVVVPVQFFQLHLNHCRRKWRGAIVTCPFNSTHCYGKPEDVFHRFVCPDRVKTDNNEYKNDTFENLFKTLADVKEKTSSACDGSLGTSNRNSKLATISSFSDLFDKGNPDGGRLGDSRANEGACRKRENDLKLDNRHQQRD